MAIFFAPSYISDLYIQDEGGESDTSVSTGASIDPEDPMRDYLIAQRREKKAMDKGKKKSKIKGRHVDETPEERKARKARRKEKKEKKAKSSTLKDVEDLLNSLGRPPSPPFKDARRSNGTTTRGRDHSVERYQDKRSRSPRQRARSQSPRRSYEDQHRRRRDRDGGSPRRRQFDD